MNKQYKIIFLIWLLMVTAIVVLGATVPYWTKPVPEETKTDADILHDMVQYHVDDYVNTGFWPEGEKHLLSNGEGFSETIDKFGDGGIYGEVMYRGPCDIRTMANLWDKSPTHKAILDKMYQNGVLIYSPDPHNAGMCIAILDVKE